MSEATSAPSVPDGGAMGESTSSPEAPQGASDDYQVPGEFSVVDQHHVENPSEQTIIEDGIANGDAMPTGEMSPEDIDLLETSIKVNGEDHSRTVADLKKDAELREASYERMEDAAKLKKSVQGMIGKFQNASPFEFAGLLQKMGHDPIAFAEAIAVEHLRRAKQSPEQREMEQFRLDKSKFTKDQASYKEERRQQKIQELVPQQIEHFTSVYTDAMDSAGIPENDGLREALMQRMAGRDMQARQQGYEIGAADLLNREWSALQAASEHYMGGVGEERKRRLKSLPDTRQFKGSQSQQKPRSSPKGRQMQGYQSGDLDAWRRMLDG